MVKVAILGCGLMGLKIAGEMAYHGHRVTMYDHNQQLLNSAFQRLQEDKQHLREEGLLPSNNFVGQIMFFSRIEETVRDAELVIEAIVENLEIKKALLHTVSQHCPSTAIITTNTLTLNIDHIMENVIHKERTTGLRFLYPVYYIPEVEFTPNSSTSREVMDKIRLMMEKMSKTLFFRSGTEPLILTDEDRESRKNVRLEEIKNSSGVGFVLQSALPALSQRNRRNNEHAIPTAPVPSTEGTNSDLECAICMDRLRNCLLCPCHHMLTCTECAKNLQNRHENCPVCRSPITEIIRVYHS